MLDKYASVFAFIILYYLHILGALEAQRSMIVFQKTWDLKLCGWVRVDPCVFIIYENWYLYCLSLIELTSTWMFTREDRFSNIGRKKL